MEIHVCKIKEDVVRMLILAEMNHNRPLTKGLAL